MALKASRSIGFVGIQIRVERSEPVGATPITDLVCCRTGG